MKCINKDKDLTVRKPWYFSNIDEKPVERNNAEEEESEIVEPQYTLYFRRPKNYQGEFGFDWLRTGDTGDHGDIWYKDIINGTIQDYDNFVAENYTHFNQQWKKEHPTYNKNYTYVVPWLTIMPGKTAELRLKLEIEEPVEKIELRFANASDSQYLILSLDNVPAIQKGSYYHSNNLKISCNKAFDKNIILEAYACDTLVGKLIILKNDIIHNIDVAIVTVETKPINKNDRNRRKAPNKNMLEKDLFKIFQQTYIVPTFFFYELDISGEVEEICTKVSERCRKRMMKNHIDKHSINNGMVKFDAKGEKNIFNYFWKKGSGGRYNTNHQSSNGYFDSISNFLSIQLYEKYPTEKKLQNAYKIFFIDEEADCTGKADMINYDSAVIFKGGYNVSTIIHEIGHCFDLYHTWTDKSLYMFDQYKTDNIMDYDEDHTDAKDRYSFWIWQIKKIQARLTNKK